MKAEDKIEILKDLQAELSVKTLDDILTVNDWIILLDHLIVDNEVKTTRNIILSNEALKNKTNEEPK